ncbi:MAG: Uma2 family endonuclease [Lachnospiraceae bacterium]|nr:Uma2 family endonuclease [Lachnospiraceae bacterium]
MALAKEKIYTEEDYYNLPEDVRAELIDGVFIYNQAAPNTRHQRLVSELNAEIRNYIKSKGGACKVIPAPFSVKLHKDRNTIVEPDISVICDESKLTERGCTGAPDWIIEITSPSNAGYDYVTKLNLYKEAGVREYWIVDPSIEKVFVYHLEDEAFSLSQYTFEDQIKVHIYDDLIIDFKELDI